MNAGVERYEEKRRRKGKKFKLILPVLFFLFIAGRSNFAFAQQNSNGVISLGVATSTSVRRLLSYEKKQIKVISNKEIFKSTQSEVVINKNEIENAGMGNAAQALQMAPGVSVRSYGGNNPSDRSQVYVRGLSQGWGSASGSIARHEVMVLFDGVPMTDYVRNAWQPNMIPILSMIEGINVIYGPGNPYNRWYGSIGGTLNFIPVQPTVKPSAEISLGTGSYNTYYTNFTLSSGLTNGWDFIFSGGYVRENTFRTGSFNAPSHSYAFFAKAVKTLNNGSLSFGAYAARSSAYRPNFIPVSPVQGVTTQGLNANGAPLYSEQTSGYYSSLPYNMWYKLIKTQILLAYSKLNLQLSPNLTFSDMPWFRHGYRLHLRVNNYIPGAPSSEDWSPYSNNYGNRLTFKLNLPYNDIKFGGDYIYATWNPIWFGTQYDRYSETGFSTFIQDGIHFGKLTVIPGLDWVGYHNIFTSYNDPTAGASSYSFSRQIFGTEPSIGASYQLFPYLRLYGNYSQTIQNPVGLSSSVAAANPGSVSGIRDTDYEAGFKILLNKSNINFLRHFVFNANYFTYHLGHEAIPLTILVNTVYTNYFAFASANYNGVDISLLDNPVKNLHLYSNLEMLHTNYTSYVSGVNQENYDNLPVSNVPDLTFNLGLSYKIPFRNYNFSLTPKFWDVYNGKEYMFNNLTGAPTNQTMPSYNIANAGIKFTTHAFKKQDIKTLGIDFSVLNLFNHQYNDFEYITSGAYFGGSTGESAGAILADPGAPRTFYLTANFKF